MVTWSLQWTSVHGLCCSLAVCSLAFTHSPSVCCFPLADCSSKYLLKMLSAPWLVINRGGGERARDQRLCSSIKKCLMLLYRHATHLFPGPFSLVEFDPRPVGRATFLGKPHVNSRFQYPLYLLQFLTSSKPTRKELLLWSKCRTHL